MTPGAVADDLTHLFVNVEARNREGQNRAQIEAVFANIGGVAYCHRALIVAALRALDGEPNGARSDCPAGGWRCFFCGEVFTTPGAARDHFGAEPFATTACQIKAGEERGLVMALRRAEEDLARYRADDSDADRAYHAMQSQHAQKVIEAEEAGYAKALADIEAGKIEPAHARRILRALDAPSDEAVERAAMALHAGVDPMTLEDEEWEECGETIRAPYRALARAALTAARGGEGT
jgi:hypothetical protein